MMELDQKLMKLIQLCKITKNDKKLAKVGFIMLKNKTYEIGVKLGIMSKVKGKNERVAKYMEKINKVFTDNLKVKIIPSEMVKKIKVLELQYLKRGGNLPYEYIVEVFNLYYELCKLDVPNLHEEADIEPLYHSTPLPVYSLFSGKQTKKQSSSDVFKELITHQLKTKEFSITKKLEDEFDRDLLKEAINLKKIMGSIDNVNGGKIKVTGVLKDNINYEYYKKSSLGFLFLGAFLTFFLLGVVLLIETVYFPTLSVHFNLLIGSVFGMSAILFLLYRNYSHRGG